MKFKFCGNFDVPDFILTEIAFLAKISAVKLRILCNQMVNFIITKGKNLSAVTKIIEDLNFSYSDAITIISVIEFILTNAVKYDVDDNVLNQEILQLGLPQENSDSISKVFKLKKNILREFLIKDIFSFDTIKNIEYKTNYVLADSYTNFEYDNVKDDENLIEDNFNIYSLQKNRVALSFNLENEEEKNDKSINLNVDKETLGKMIQDLEKCSTAIRNYKEQE